jgi:hypothetical protein
MSTSSGGGFIETAEDDEAEQATEDNNTTGVGAGTSPPVGSGVSNDDYTRQRHKSTDARTDIRTVDGHASWRQVARACHVNPGR